MEEGGSVDGGERGESVLVFQAWPTRTRRVAGSRWVERVSDIPSIQHRSIQLKSVICETSSFVLPARKTPEVSHT